MSLSNDIESKDLAISLFWTSEYVKDNEIKPEFRLCVANKTNNLKQTIGFYINKDNTSRYVNFRYILHDLIYDNVYFVKEKVE